MAALAYAKLGRDYFRRIGDSARARVFEEDCARLEAAIAAYLRQGVDNRPRLR